MQKPKLSWLTSDGKSRNTRNDGWLTSDGKVISMPGYGHAEMAIEGGLVKIEEVNPNKAEDSDIDDIAIRKGHIRFIYANGKLTLHANALDSNTKDVLRTAFSEGIFPEGRVWLVWGYGQSGRDKSFDSMEDARDWMDHIVTGAVKKQWLYHVTFSGYLDGISQHGLIPNAEPGITGGGEKGKVFVTEASGVSHWLERAQNWAYHRADNPAESGLVPVVVRFPRKDVQNIAEDEIGTRENTQGAYKADSVSPDNIQLWDGKKWDGLWLDETIPVADDEGYLLDGPVQKPKLAKQLIDDSGWLTTDGKFHPNGNLVHEEAAKKLGIGSNGEGTNGAEDKGHIRVGVGGGYLFFEGKYNNDTTRNLIISTIPRVEGEHLIGVDIGGVWEMDMKPEQAMEWLQMGGRPRSKVRQWHEAAESLAAKRINFQGIPIQIEWPRGTTRRGTNPDGAEWSNLMYADYGFILPNVKPNVPVIEEFLKHYEREVDYYEEASEIAKEKLEEALQAVGIRAQVTFRAKSPKRLKKKLYRRLPTKYYKTFRDIYQDIVDLCGVRVALYLPADKEAVGHIIDQLFEEARPVKHFPEDNGPGDETGYIANHYLVRLKSETLDGSDRRYAETKIEIQVASVLMHAYAEISHDLIYKPEKGNLNPDEKLLLSQLNEIVRGGEVALERLQEKIEGRTNEDLRFELVGSCIKKASAIVTAAGWSTDNEPADVYVGEDYDSPFVYAVEQLKPNGEFDEFKFMLGFSTLEHAHEIYLKHFQDTAHPREIEGIYEISMKEFRTALEQHVK